ncbi:hypothetical protein [Ornithinimicrobium kibberense]
MGRVGHGPQPARGAHRLGGHARGAGAARCRRRGAPRGGLRDRRPGGLG